MHPGQMIRRSARIYAGNTAVKVDGFEQTYGEMFERANRLANALRSLGVLPGDRVATLGNNGPETLEQVAACALGNFARATLYTYHSAETNRYLLEHIGARAILVQDTYYKELQPLLSNLPGLDVVVYGTTPDGALDYEELIATSSDEEVDVPVLGSDIHIIRFSSGTTGRPKGIVHSVDRWMAYNSEWRWVTPMLDETSTYFVPVALAHLGVAFLWQTLAVGGCILMQSTFEARSALDLLESENVTHTAVVPVMIKSMLELPGCESRSFPHLQCVMYSGSPITQTTLKRALTVFGPVMFQLYAQSEVMPMTMLLPYQHVTEGSDKETARLRSVGRATPNVNLTVRDEDGLTVPAGVVGEVAATSPGSMSAIWNDPDSFAERTLPDGSILTRDMGYLDEEGFLYLVDRKDDMIVSGAYNIWPTELEEVLAEHPGVEDVCVVGVPDERWGETPKALVVLSPGYEVSETDLIAYSRDRLGGVKKITSVEFVAELPRSGAGKLLRAQLKKRFWGTGTVRIRGS